MEFGFNPDSNHMCHLCEDGVWVKFHVLAGLGTKGEGLVEAVVPPLCEKAYSYSFIKLRNTYTPIIPRAGRSSTIYAI